MEPVSKRKLYQDVLDRLISAISRSEFPLGSQLPSERDLMTMLGVGRPAIREAMQSLEQMGLIKISHGERARVIKPSADFMVDRLTSPMIMLLASNPDGLAELKEARLWLETGLVGMATRNATARDLDRLADSIRQLKEARGDPTKFIETDMAFHGLIADMSGNSLVATVTKGMLIWLSRFKTDLVSVRGADRLTIEEHEKIYRAISTGDAQTATKLMADHINRANDLYRSVSDPADML